VATIARSYAADGRDVRSASPTQRDTSRAVRTLASSQTVNAVGDGCYNVTAAFYFTSVVGLSAIQTGMVMTLGWSLAVMLSTQVGRLADRVGLRLAMIGLTVSTAMALVGIAITRSPAAAGIAFAWYAVSQGALGGTRQALLARVVPPQKRVHVRARVQVLVNSGFGAGALVGGAAFWCAGQQGLSVALLIDVATFTVAAVLLLGLPDLGAATGGPWGRLEVLRDRPYVIAAALASVLFIYMPLLTVALPLYLTSQTQVAPWLFALVLVVNTVGVMAYQLGAASRVTDLDSARRSVRDAGAVLASACVLFFVAGRVGPAMGTVAVLAGAILQVLGEVRLAAGSWYVSFALADPQRPGQWQGLWMSGLPLARALGPLSLTALVVDGPPGGWFVVAAAFVVAGGAFAHCVRNNPRGES
jgi:Major Facilitator Superfamily